MKELKEYEPALKIKKMFESSLLFINYIKTFLEYIKLINLFPNICL